MLELTPGSVVTSAEINTRSMVSISEGLPCWYPEPRGLVGDRGIVPGDVGTFDLMVGFTKIFNIWEDAGESFAHQLPPKQYSTCLSYFDEGHCIQSGVSIGVSLSEDRRCV